MTENALDVIALTVGLPEYNLWCKQVGTVVEWLAENAALEVQFSDAMDALMDSVGLHPEQTDKLIG